MPRVSKHNIPGQLSLFDYVAKMQDTQKEIHKENIRENNLLEEILYGNRQQYGRSANNSSVSAKFSNSNDQTASKFISLLDIGKMGNEQPREIDNSVREGHNSPIGTSEQSRELGTQGNLFGTGRRSNEPRLQSAGNIGDNGDKYRAVNYEITENDNLGKGGAKAKYHDNINAIKTLYKIKEENRNASLEEQKILVKYVGWGGLPQVFDENNATWAKEYDELRSLISDSDYVKARRSTQDAHFTSETVINGIYEGIKHLGVHKTQSPLKILEPSSGIGHFIGLKPKEFSAKFFAIEQDSLTSEIANLLYPREQHKNTGFQDTEYAKGLFDLTIGNPPFGQQKLFDKNFPQLSIFSIHNYFIAKSLDLIKEGGIGAFVVSRYFMDTQTLGHRSYIADNSHFLGAIRLPSNAFSENALTDVTTDIVFFQKKTQLEKEQGIIKGNTSWEKLSEVSFYDQQTDDYKFGTINRYFADYPEQILGEMQFVRGQFADELKCIAFKDGDLKNQISQAIKALPQNIFSFTESEHIEIVDNKAQDFIQSEYFKNLKMDSLCKYNSKIYSKKKDEYGEEILFEEKTRNIKEYQRISSMIDLRDTLRSLINLEKTSNDDKAIEEKRSLLNFQYNKFQDKYGFLNSLTNKGLFKYDPESSLIQSLEKNYDRGITKEQAEKIGRQEKAPSATKSDIFHKRILKPIEVASHADTTKDALAICLSEKGTVDFERISSLVKKTSDEVQQELQNEKLVFLNPLSQEWEIKDKYLTGNVKEKLSIAERYANNNPEIYQSNINALTEVIPLDIEAIDIGVRLGSSWVPPRDILDFIDEELGSLSRYSTKLDYIPLLGKWDAKISIYDHAINTELWGTKDYPADQLIQSILTNKAIKVEREIGRDINNKPIKEIDQEATAVAMRKAKAIEQAFTDWIWKDDERRERLARSYNDKFNTHVVPKYDGSHLELVGASDEVSLRPHQKDAVWRAMQEGTALFDHVVGAGKTLAATAMVKESKRMGFFQKPMIVVPNHLVYQWRDEFFKLYPDANILVATKEDFLKQNRERFFSRVATNDWDAVIVAHSSFKKIDMPKQVEKEILEEQIHATMSALESLKEDGGNRSTVKQLEKQKEKIQERYNNLIAGAGNKDRSVDFSDLGVDALIVDEAHEFKNLNFTTTMNVSGLGNVTGSAKALDLFIKCRYLQRENEGKGVYFLTGTPISNSISEVYTLQRYLQFDELSKKGLEFFDSWASTFAKVSSDWELDATGVNYKLKSRFAKFDNVPELLSMYRTFADVVTQEDIDKQRIAMGLRPNTPPLLEEKPISHIAERSESQAHYMNKIIDRMENLPSDPRIDNPLKITNDARKAGLDYRLIDPTAPDFTGTKVNACADKIHQIWQESMEDKGTQLVFCDLSTPKKSDIVSEDKTVNFVGDEFAENDDSQAKEIDMDEVLAFQGNNNFSVYNDLKNKLIEKGIPSHEIAFIHDANTDQRKSKLFGEVKNGDVRVLLGSTAKMGSGTNVQDKLVAAHHLDCPWRPSDLAQRNGRIIRQGNQLYENDPDNFKVGIYYYATKQTYDARMWQCVEYKANAIEQFRKGDLLQRQIDDVRSEAATAAEMKAAASGNPLILMEVNLSNELKNLEALSSEFSRSKHRLASRIKYLEDAPKRLEEIEENFKNNMELRDKNTRMTKENGKDKIVIELYRDGKTYTKDHAKQMQDIVSNCVQDTVIKRKIPESYIGKYRGFDINLKASPLLSTEGFYLTLGGKNSKYFPQNLNYTLDEKFSLTGLFQRIDNFLEKGITEKYHNEINQNQKEQTELTNTKTAYDKEFDLKDELTLARENHTNVILELQKMKDNSEYISTWQPITIEEYKSNQGQNLAKTNIDNIHNSLEIQTVQHTEKEELVVKVGNQKVSIPIQNNYPPVENAFDNSNKYTQDGNMLVDKEGTRFRMR